MPKRQVYFDHLSSTPVLPEVFEAMRPYFTEHCGNPAALHRHGLQARDALDEARARVAALVGAESPEEILFTSGATESANLALKGIAGAARGQGRHIVVTATDHPAVLNSAAFLEQHGFSCTRVGVDAEGFARPEDVLGAITAETVLICVHQANHDLGTIQPVERICAGAAGRGVPVFVDAAASGGWLPIDVRSMGASLLSLAPHRFHGPKGVGVLYCRRGVRIQSQLHGGVQEIGHRAGTENVPAIVGAGMAAELAAGGLTSRVAGTAALQRRLWDGLHRRIPYIRLNGPAPGPGRLSTNLNLSVEFVEGEGVALMADVQGVAIASGAACVSKAREVPPVLKAIGLAHSLAQGNILISLGCGSNDADVDYALDVLPAVVARLRAMSPLWDEFERGEIGSKIALRRFAD